MEKAVSICPISKQNLVLSEQYQITSHKSDGINKQNKLRKRTSGERYYWMNEVTRGSMLQNVGNVKLLPLATKSDDGFPGRWMRNNGEFLW